MNKSVVIIPTYNEIENVELIIQAVFDLGQGYHVLIVDDSSPDGTADKVRELQSVYAETLYLEVRSEKTGLGTAYIHGFKWALSKDYAFIFEMDADFSHNPKELKPMQELLEKEADLVVGSRYVKGVNVVNWPLSRVLLSYFASVYVRVVTGMPVNDATAGFVGYKREVLENIDLNSIKFVGYAFQIELKYKAWIKKYVIKEHPIIFVNRERGNSKMNGSIIWEALFGVLSLRLNKKRFLKKS